MQMHTFCQQQNTKKACLHSEYECIGYKGKQTLQASKSNHLANYLDLTLMIDSGGKLSTRPYDKRDDFVFHIVNFPFSGPSYELYISQLIGYARCCPHFEDFRCHHKCLVDRLLSKGYIALQLENRLINFMADIKNTLTNCNQRSVNLFI